MSDITEDFPEPEEPTKAIDSPFLIFKLKFFRTFTSGLEGYAKVTLINSTMFSQFSRIGFSWPDSTLIGSSMISNNI